MCSGHLPQALAYVHISTVVPDEAAVDDWDWVYRAGFRLQRAPYVLQQYRIDQSLNHAADISGSSCGLQDWESGHGVQGHDHSMHHVLRSGMLDPV